MTGFCLLQLEAESPRSEHQQGWILVRSLFQVGGGLVGRDKPTFLQLWKRHQFPSWGCCPHWKGAGPYWVFLEQTPPLHVLCFSSSVKHLDNSIGCTFPELFCRCENPSPNRQCYLVDHATKVMFKILQARLQQQVNHELPDVQAGFRKGRGTRDQIANIYWIIE